MAKKICNDNIKTKEIRDGIVEFLKQKYTAAAVKIDGHNFAAVDIAVDAQGDPEIYRVTVVKHAEK